MTVDDPMDRCGAKTKRGHCRQVSGWGTSHVGTGRCKNHGGASPQAEVAGQVVLARREYQVMGIPLDISPQDALLECIRIAAGEVAYASGRIAELSHAEAVVPAVSTLDRPLKEVGGAEDPRTIVQEIRTEAPALNVWIEVRRQAMDRLVQYSATALKVGLEARLVQIAERTAEKLAEAVDGILTDLGVRDHPEAPQIVRRHLTLLNRFVA
jgi:hypothetical protein